MIGTGSRISVGCPEGDRLGLSDGIAKDGTNDADGIPDGCEVGKRTIKPAVGCGVDTDDDGVVGIGVWTTGVTVGATL